MEIFGIALNFTPNTCSEDNLRAMSTLYLRNYIYIYMY